MIKLLLVEDDASLRYIVQGGLEDMIGGYEVIAAANGEEGLKQWKEQHPDVIVSDIEMPVMNGLVATRKIREFNSDIPIVALTANAFDTDRASAMDAGCNAFLPKPVKRKQLFELLSGACR